MVKMIPDNMGRFARRPFYQERELDNECERLIGELLLKRRGKIAYPVDTEDLEVLIEMHDADLDSCADLSSYGDDVEGVTEFFPDRGPKVSISDRIAADDRRENRLRTTLTHEFGHVKFHGPLWAEKFATGDMLERGVNANKAISKRDNMLNAPKTDWMEWQAGYISGALLMPATPVRRLVSDYCSPRELHGDIHKDSDHAGNLVQLLVKQFAVSEEAARIRLLKLNLIKTVLGSASLFDR
ncbi:ImmA/IrrE family metallo-endopeptidase [Alterinioella nitratireducens]|uniref:ImmA/IrrE family metallo-endopeptidase n=1 Tax=Alterinioella nitratireducens TaxID=2735915 RepID=UPI0015522804|nr:ImmA/IrrE family metallo-endopeptidase [Alterinioella nitratireducens]NPD18845.1 ImmA/IrrE family metallo-endopeptidase [Alterinioella nitratireducens]